MAALPDGPVGQPAPKRLPPFRGQGLTVSVGRDGFTVFATDRTGRAAIKAEERNILYRDLDAVQLTEPSQSAPGNVSIRYGTLWFAVRYGPEHAERARELAQHLRDRHRALAGKDLGATLTKKQKAESLTRAFDRDLEQKVGEIVAAIRAADTPRETALTNRLLDWAQNHPAKKGPRDAMARLASVRAQQRLPSPQLVAVVQPESFAEFASRTGKMLSYQYGVPIQVFEDRVEQGGKAYPIDGSTQAQVYLDGQSQITTRPTATRAVLLSPLPGSALLPALAFAKKEKHDTRVAEFQVGGQGWTFTVPVSPDRMSGPRATAQRVNSIAAAKDAEHARAAAAAAARPTQPMPTDLVSQIERVVALEESGAITAEQAAALKARLISGG